MQNEQYSKCKTSSDDEYGYNRSKNHRSNVDSLSEIYLLIFGYIVAFSFGIMCTNSHTAHPTKQPAILAIPLCLLRIYTYSMKYLVKLTSSTCLAYLLGYYAGLAINIANYTDPSIVVYASLITAAVFLGFSLIACVTKSEHILIFGGFMAACLMALCMTSTLMMIFPISIAGYEMLYLGCCVSGVIIFSGCVAYDTVVMIERIKEGDVDPFHHAMNLFLDIVNIFIELIKILIILKDKNSDEDEYKQKNKE